MPLATIIGRTHKFITDEFEQRINASGIDVSMVEFVLLYRLSTMDDDKITQQNFANMEGKHKSVILRQINKLEQKKWVVRTGDFTDLRKNMIIITKAGLSVLRQVLAIEAEMMIELTEIMMWALLSDISLKRWWLVEATRNMVSIPLSGRSAFAPFFAFFGTSAFSITGAASGTGAVFFSATTSCLNNSFSRFSCFFLLSNTRQYSV